MAASVGNAVPAAPLDALREQLLARMVPATAEQWAALEAAIDEEDAALDALDREPPSEEELLGLIPDPESDPPDGPNAWLADLPEPLREEYYAATAESSEPEVIKAGFCDRRFEGGCGFASGGLADTLPPGAALAGLADRAWEDGLGRLSDDELIGVLRAARRLTSWAAALELAAVNDLLERRLAEEEAGEAGVAEHAGDEIAAALTLTGRSADRLVDLAMMLARLPRTSRALAAGEIDLPRAAVIADETSALGPGHRAAVEEHILRRASRQTTGQLRASARSAVYAADPSAARRRKEKALREARVERWAEDAGTAALAGRDLPPADVLAADENLSELAGRLKDAGVPGTMDNLRALVYLALLRGQPVSSLLPGEPGEPVADTAGKAGASPTVGPFPAPQANSPAWPARIGRVNLTLPVATWLGVSEQPGQVAGYGPLDADDARTIAAALASRAGSAWCLTLIDADGRPVAHGCARPRSPGDRPAARAGPGEDGAATAHAEPQGNRATAARAGPGGDNTVTARARSDGDAGTATARAGPSLGEIAWTFTIRPLAAEPCSHTRETRAYRPSPGLRHILEIRNTTCTFPGCRRPATRCDQDHTIPYAGGGRTCECNVGPRCRRHHRAKQSHGWQVEQVWPGEQMWITPSGRAYTTGATEYE